MFSALTYPTNNEQATLSTNFLNTSYVTRLDSSVNNWTDLDQKLFLLVSHIQV